MKKVNHFFLFLTFLLCLIFSLIPNTNKALSNPGSCVYTIDGVDIIVCKKVQYTCDSGKKVIRCDYGSGTCNSGSQELCD